MQQFVLLMKALSDETRLRIILALTAQELCVCQITALLNLAPSTVSKHISLLLQSRLVEKRKCGKWAYYSLAQKDASPEIKTALSFVSKTLSRKASIQKDLASLKKILALPPEILCQTPKKKNGGAG